MTEARRRWRDAEPGAAASPSSHPAPPPSASPHTGPQHPFIYCCSRVHCRLSVLSHSTPPSIRAPKVGGRAPTQGC